MNLIRRAFLCIALLSFIKSYSQTLIPDSVRHHQHDRRWKNVIGVPVILIGAGLITSTDNDVVDKWKVKDDRNKVAPHFHTHMDDYLQYASIVGVYGLDAFHVKARNNIANQTALLIKSELLMTAITYPLKKIIAEPRPDTGAPNSFPSGHTASFCGRNISSQRIWTGSSDNKRTWIYSSNNCRRAARHEQPSLGM
jgi:hypothetical protein